jgi:cell division protein DivIC
MINFIANPFQLKLLTQLPAWLRNKFIIAFVAFAVWMLFFDERDLFTMRHHRQELRELQESKKYYTDQINNEKTQLENLKAAATLEKYAREKYYMKRDNEDLFLIPEKQDN